MALDQAEFDVVLSSTTTMAKRDFDRVKKQFQVVLIGNILAFSQGSNVAWFSPALPLLYSESSPLIDGPISHDTAGNIGTFLAVGGICGSLGFGLMANWIGYKRAMQCAAFPITISWLLIIFGNYSWHLCLARFFSGLTGGAAFTCFPQFVAEIASDRIRGQLSSYIQIAGFSGVLLGFISGSYLSYTVNPIVMISFPIAFFIGFYSIPESPQFLLKNNQIKEAESSLRYYRNVTTSDDAMENQLVRDEFDKLSSIAMQNDQTPPLTVSDFVNPVALRAMMISPFLMIVNQFSGSFAISNYAETIFKSTGSTFDPQISAIVMAAVQVVGTYTTSQLMDRVGRKVLLLVSLGGCCIAHLITGIYCYLAKHDYDVNAFNLVPIISISTFIFMSSIGILPVPFIMLAEVIPQRIRRIACTFCTSVSFIGQMIMLRIMPTLLGKLDLYVSVWMFASFALAGLLFTIFVVRETKGKNLDVLEERPTNK